ncbi:NlpC/P60 family protein [Streptomyces microflavus]|uniref:NlpC/P60 family protein n=1 Tax=Streptomyces microflavus TaxID=1919 RepID=UPI003808558F
MNGRDALGAAASAASAPFKLKVAAVGAVAFLIFLLVVGIFGAGVGGKAFADSCGKRGQPGAEVPGGDTGGGSAEAPGAGMRKKQIANAEIIDGVAEKEGLSGRATLIGLMTALQESTLLNLDYGHADSIGLFQQRPSQGWGTKEQIMNPKYSATMFFMGDKDGSPRGLTDVKGWESMDMGAAAQKVQVSAHPDLYAGQEDAAREIARLADIDLDRPGKGGADQDEGGDQGDQGDAANGDDGAGECYDEGGAGKPGKPGEAFHDGAAGWPAQVKNPRSTAAAIKWAENETSGGKDWYRACLAFVAQAYGWSYSGVNYAIDHYKEMPANMKHDKDREPPPGALMYWDTGQRAGHVAIYLGNGKIASNDIERPGYIDVVPATDIETKWGATYLGWAPPYFPKGG